MLGVNIAGSKLVANAQTVIVYVVLGILTVFAVVTLVNMNPSLLAFSGIFTFITAAHFRVRTETGASVPVLVLAITTAGAVLLTFVFTTLVHEPASMVALAAILLLSIVLDYGWKRARTGRADHLQAVN